MHHGVDNLHLYIETNSKQDNVCFSTIYVQAGCVTYALLFGGAFFLFVFYNMVNNRGLDSK